MQEFPRMCPENPTVSALTRDYEVHAHDADYTQRASLEAVCRWFQDAAWRHAEKLGVGFSRLREQRRLWVLSRLAVEVRSFPRWGDKATVVTWPRASKSVFAMREFELRNSAGELLVAATSAWLVVDSQTRKPLRADKLLTSIPALSDRTATGREPGKLRDFGIARNGTAMPVRYGDLDVNSHVNAARYVGWLLDSYPIDYFRNHVVNSLEINYLDETVAGDTVAVSWQETTPGEFCHSVAKLNPSVEVCRARLTWAQERG